MNETIYPSDLTDEEWEWIKDLIPAAKSGGRPRTLCMRAVLNAIFYVTKGGIQWRMLPVNFPKWQSVYHYLRTWNTSSVPILPQGEQFPRVICLLALLRSHYK